MASTTAVPSVRLKVQGTDQIILNFTKRGWGKLADEGIFDDPLWQTELQLLVKFLFANWESTDDPVQDIRIGLYSAGASESHVSRFLGEVQKMVLKGAGAIWFGALEQVKEWDPEKKEESGVYAMLEEIYPIMEELHDFSITARVFPNTYALLPSAPKKAFDISDKGPDDFFNLGQAIMDALYELYPKDKNWRSEDYDDLNWQTLRVFHDLVGNNLARAIGWSEDGEEEGEDGETSAKKPGDGEDESGEEHSGDEEGAGEPGEEVGGGEDEEDEDPLAVRAKRAHVCKFDGMEQVEHVVTVTLRRLRDENVIE